MAKILSTDVHVHTDDGTVIYHAGETVPSEHAKLITNPNVWEDDGAEASEPKEPKEPKTKENAPKAAHSEESNSIPVPPQAGAGSDRDAWLDYAKKHGFDVEPDAKKGDIIAALKDAGIPVTKK